MDNNLENKKKIIIGITGASGVLYGVRLIQALLDKNVDISLVISSMGKQVLEHELSCKNIKNLFNEKNEKAEKAGLIKIYENDNFFAPMASGAFKHDGMVVCPCSITTLSKIASGIADNLICRASDVCLKERLPLILLVRETPLNAIHLQNMYKLSLTGAIIMPASPGFYFHPNSINDLVGSLIGKILNLLKIKNDISKQWGNIY